VAIDLSRQRGRQPGAGLLTLTDEDMMPMRTPTMDLPRKGPIELGADTYLFVSLSGANITALSEALAQRGTVIAVPPGNAMLDERISMLSPQALFLDFSGTQAAAACEVHESLKRDWPELPVLGCGAAAESASMLAALRAGVDDFVDLAGPAAEVVRTLVALLERRSKRSARARGCTVALLGARAGLGVSTLATSLALTLQDLITQTAQASRAQAQREPGMLHRGAALLDLGLPARDGLLYLDTESSFSFVDGVHNLRRLDQTLMRTALAHHTSGLAILPLPSSLAQVREISHAESVSLIRRLGDFFDFQIADLGGFTTIDFIAQAVRDADKAWLVCDQSISGVVATASLLKELNARGLESQRFSLVVNKFDSHVGLPARDIAARLGIALGHVLPARSTALLAAASRGEMLVRTARHDAYVQAVLGMAKTLRLEFGAAGALPSIKDSRWSALMAQLTGRRKSVKGV
jgi:pilus assembly protein CpaE